MYDELEKVIRNSRNVLRFNKCWGSDVSKELHGNNRNKIGQWLVRKNLNGNELIKFYYNYVYSM